MMNILGTLRADNGDANENVAKNGFSIPSNFFAIVSIPTVIKKRENLIGAEERGTRPKRQTEMVEFNISSCQTKFYKTA